MADTYFSLDNLTRDLGLVGAAFLFMIKPSKNIDNKMMINDQGIKAEIVWIEKKNKDFWFFFILNKFILIDF